MRCFQFVSYFFVITSSHYFVWFLCMGVEVIEVLEGIDS